MTCQTPSEQKGGEKEEDIKYDMTRQSPIHKHADFSGQLEPDSRKASVEAEIDRCVSDVFHSKKLHHSLKYLPLPLTTYRHCVLWLIA